MQEDGDCGNSLKEGSVFSGEATSVSRRCSICSRRREMRTKCCGRRSLNVARRDGSTCSDWCIDGYRQCHVTPCEQGQGGFHYGVVCRGCAAISHSRPCKCRPGEGKRHYKLCQGDVAGLPPGGREGLAVRGHDYQHACAARKASDHKSAPDQNSEEVPFGLKGTPFGDLFNNPQFRHFFKQFPSNPMPECLGRG